jgi:hypothetical protein
MRPRGRLGTAAAVAAGLGVHALLLTGALAWLPAAARVGLAAGVVILLPGSALVALGQRPHGWRGETLAWAIGLGVAWNAALLALVWLGHRSFLPLAGWTLASSAGLWALTLVRSRSTDAPAAPRLSAWASAAVALAVAVACLHAARFGPPMGYGTDSPEYVSTLRHMLETGEPLAGSAYHPREAAPGSDARKSLWHGEAALIVRLSGLEPVVAWRWLGVFLVPLFVLNAASLGARVGGAGGAALAAWVCVLASGGGLVQTPLRQAAFGSRLADQLVLTAVLAVLDDLAAPRRGSRVAAAALAFGAVAVHLGAALQLAVGLGALAAGLAVRDRAPSQVVRRLLATGAVMAAAALPYAVLRVRAIAPTANVLHTEPQGLLFLTDRLQVGSPGLLWEQMGMAWVLVPLAWPWLWKHGRGDPAILYLLTASLAAVLIVYNPFVVPMLEPRIGYLMWRVVWLIPFAALLGWMLPRLAGAARWARSGARRLAAAGALVGALALLAPALLDAAHLVAHPGILADPDRDGPQVIADALRRMDRELRPGAVVLSDPATSYAIPMRTRLTVTHLADQHSSPADPHAVRRMLDARDALDPFATWARTREVVARYGVEAIALNGRFAEPPRLDYWTPTPAWYAAARARLDARPDAFPRVFDTGDFVVYRVNPAALDTLSGPAAPRPFVRPFRPGIDPVARSMGEGLPALLAFHLERRRLAPGDTLRGALLWRAQDRAPAGSYQVFLRFDRRLPGGLRPPALVAKPARKLLERLRGELYRFRVDRLPTGGAYGVDLWGPDEVVRDSIEAVVPPTAAQGRWRIQVRMLRQPHYPNLRLRDYFVDDDSYAGMPVGWLEIGAGGPPDDRAAGGH